MDNSSGVAESLLAPLPARKREPAAARAWRGPSVDRVRHRLRGVPFRASPNCDARPKPRDISLLVVHAISLPPGRFGGPSISRLFTNALDCDAHPYFDGLRGLKVSAHACIFRNGRIIQYVPFHRRAWHAGASEFEGRTACNDFSIGIELEGCDDRPFESVQYRALARVARALIRAYPKITPARIKGHSDIAPGRKTDPGPCFDWKRLHAEMELLP